jgi:uncharacterized protein YpmB
MERRKVDLIIFWIGALYIIIIGFIASYWVRAMQRYLSIKEAKETSHRAIRWSKLSRLTDILIKNARSET